MRIPILPSTALHRSIGGEQSKLITMGAIGNLFNPTWYATQGSKINASMGAYYKPLFRAGR